MIYLKTYENYHNDKYNVGDYIFSSIGLYDIEEKGVCYINNKLMLKIIKLDECNDDSYLCQTITDSKFWIKNYHIIGIPNKDEIEEYELKKEAYKYNI